MEERLQKILSHAGYGSRRASEELISQGRVTVNGQPATLGMKADPQKDHINVDGKPVNVWYMVPVNFTLAEDKK